MAFSPFRKSRGPVELAVDMAGVRLGERLLQVGVGIPKVFARLAGKAGLTGRACAVAADEAGVRTLHTAAAREGVFAEVSTNSGLVSWPFESASFDVAIVDGALLLDPGLAAAILSELRRCLRPGARAVALYHRPRGMLVRLGFERRRETSDEARLFESLLLREGFRPVRPLAEREGLTFVEGFRAL